MVLFYRLHERCKIYMRDDNEKRITGSESLSMDVLEINNEK